jgi:hypothetical protein
MFLLNVSEQSQAGSVAAEPTALGRWQCLVTGCVACVSVRAQLWYQTKEPVHQARLPMCRPPLIA